MRTCEACKGTTYDEGGEPCDPCAGSGLVGHPADEATAMTKHSPGPWKHSGGAIRTPDGSIVVGASGTDTWLVFASADDRRQALLDRIDGA